MRAATPADAAHFSARTGCHFTPAARGVVACAADGAPRGMVLLDAWTHTGAQAHVLLETPAAGRTLLPAAVRWAFGPAGRTVLLGLIPLHHRRSRALAQRLGFREGARVADGYAAGDALILYTLRREDCALLKESPS